MIVLSVISELIPMPPLMSVPTPPAPPPPPAGYVPVPVPPAKPAPLAPPTVLFVTARRPPAAVMEPNCERVPLNPASATVGASDGHVPFSEPRPPVPTATV